MKHSELSNFTHAELETFRHADLKLDALNLLKRHDTIQLSEELSKKLQLISDYQPDDKQHFMAALTNCKVVLDLLTSVLKFWDALPEPVQKAIRSALSLIYDSLTER